ncbi:2038_t:CDS:2, partial [Funneliformis geosporum]
SSSTVRQNSKDNFWDLLSDNHLELVFLQDDFWKQLDNNHLAAANQADIQALTGIIQALTGAFEEPNWNAVNNLIIGLQAAVTANNKALTLRVVV